MQQGRGWSPSLRGRGLKCYFSLHNEKTLIVALFARAWIEIHFERNKIMKITVALFARAWIEILMLSLNLSVFRSRPLCEGVD